MPPATMTAQGQHLALNARRAGGPPYPVPARFAVSPASDLIRGVDGRAFSMEDPAAVINATRLPIALDFDHASSMVPFNSQPGIAAGSAASVTE